MDGRPFVGREAELAELRRLVAEAEAGRGRLVLVTGDAGIGKTRTTERALEDVPPARVFWGRCHETEGAPAYWPWRQVLRAYARSRPTDELRSEIADAAADVAQLVPELTERLGSSVAPDVAPEHARFLLFDAVAGWLRRASARALLVLAFDDLHWADSGSLLLLRSVAGELRDGEQHVAQFGFNFSGLVRGIVAGIFGRIVGVHRLFQLGNFFADFWPAVRGVLPVEIEFSGFLTDLLTA